MYKNQYDSGDDTSLAWDLRQGYAKYIFSYMIKFREAEEVNYYPEMLKCLDKWFYAIRHEWLDEEEGDKYFDYRKELVELARKNQGVYFKKKFESKPMQDIEFTLQKMKSYLILQMKKSKLFGETWNDDGL